MAKWDDLPQELRAQVFEHVFAGVKVTYRNIHQKSWKSHIWKYRTGAFELPLVSQTFATPDEIVSAALKQAEIVIYNKYAIEALASALSPSQKSICKLLNVAGDFTESDRVHDKVEDDELNDRTFISAQQIQNAVGAFALVVDGLCDNYLEVYDTAHKSKSLLHTLLSPTRQEPMSALEVNVEDEYRLCTLRREEGELWIMKAFTDYENFYDGVLVFGRILRQTMSTKFPLRLIARLDYLEFGSCPSDYIGVSDMNLTCGHHAKRVTDWCFRH